MLTTFALAPPVLAVDDPSTPPVPAPFQVDLGGSGFTPATINVVAGQSVVFTNTSGATRTVTGASGIFDSGPIVAGGAFTVAVPDNRTIVVSSPGPPAFTATLRVGPNGFPGPGSDPVNSHLPTNDPPLDDGSSIGVDPEWGIVASRTTIMVTFQPTATVAQANALVAATHSQVLGGIGTFGITILGIGDRADKSFADMDAALTVLRASPAVQYATMDVVGDTTGPTSTTSTTRPGQTTSTTSTTSSPTTGPPPSGSTSSAPETSTSETSTPEPSGPTSFPPTDPDTTLTIPDTTSPAGPTTGGAVSGANGTAPSGGALVRTGAPIWPLLGLGLLLALAGGVLSAATRRRRRS